MRAAISLGEHCVTAQKMAAEETTGNQTWVLSCPDNLAQMKKLVIKGDK